MDAKYLSTYPCLMTSVSEMGEIGEEKLAGLACGVRRSNLFQENEDSGDEGLVGNSPTGRTMTGRAGGLMNCKRF